MTSRTVTSLEPWLAERGDSGSRSRPSESLAWSKLKVCGRNTRHYTRHVRVRVWPSTDRWDSRSFRSDLLTTNSALQFLPLSSTVHRSSIFFSWNSIELHNLLPFHFRQTLSWRRGSVVRTSVVCLWLEDFP